MKAVVLRGTGDVRLEEVPDPVLKVETDAIVRIDAAAIGGADLFLLHGLTPGFDSGTILGHEFAGIVVEVGRAAPCGAGRVPQCSGRALCGYSGVYPRLDGAQADFVRVPHADTVLSPLPDSVSDDAAVFLADNLPTADAAVVRGGVKRG